MLKNIPTRVQRRRTKGSKLPANTLCCTRPGFWSNPLVGKDAAKWFRLWLVEYPEAWAYELADMARSCGDDVRLRKFAAPYEKGQRYLDNLERLREYDHLGCWCGLDVDCHVETYRELLTDHRKAATVARTGGA